MSSDDKTVMFTGTVEVPARPAGAAAGPLPCKLICLDQSRLPDPTRGLEIDLSGKEQTVGRGEENTVPLNATGISKRHARFYFSNGGWRVQDMGSTNGVHVNDAKVEDAPLKPGDTIKIGKIPFQFVMVRPDIKGTVTKDGRKHEADFDPDKTVSERTMFVGSNLMAAAMLLDAKNRQQEAEKRAAATPARRGAAHAAAMTPAAVRKKGAGLKWAALAVLLAAIAGGGYWYFGRGGSGAEAALKNSRAEVKAFMRDNEDSAGHYSAAEHQKQATQLGNMMAELSEATSQYPNSTELKAVMAQVLFLQFERNLMNLIQQGKPDQAIPLLAQAQSEFDKLSAGGAETKDDDSKKIYSDVASLLELAGPVIRIKAFAQRYPNPAKDAKSAPSKGEMEQIRKLRDQFAELRKKNNLALSVNYLLFNGIVGDVDDKDVLVVDKWGAVTRAN